MQSTSTSSLDFEFSASDLKRMDFALPYATFKGPDRLALLGLLQQAQCPPKLSAQYFLLYRSELKATAKEMDLKAMAKAHTTSSGAQPKRVKAYATALFRLLAQIDSALMREMATDLKLEDWPEDLNPGEESTETSTEPALPERPGEHWYDETTWEIAHAEASAGTSDESREWKRALQSLKDAGIHKPYATLPDLLAFDELKKCHPNFAEVIEFIAAQVAMAKRKKASALRMPPVLLEGPPGVGKSHFANALASVMGTTVHTVNTASQTAGFVLSGLHRSWSNGCMGDVATCLKRSDTLSPVFFLDELDKAGREGKSDPLGPLYALLEKDSAARFMDEYLSVGINASLISWIAAANEASHLPPPLLSRFTRFAIAAPTPDDMRQLAQSHYQQMRCGWPELPEYMPGEWLTALAPLSPRTMGQRLERALGLVAMRAEKTNSSCLSLKADDIYIETIKRPRMGFLSG